MAGGKRPWGRGGGCALDKYTLGRLLDLQNLLLVHFNRVPLHSLHDASFYPLKPSPTSMLYLHLPVLKILLYKS